ncbi:hypothetical protein Barb6_02184 [Bacteroidales bacterium Barb6]|nr:hypothetical protein Barb6_02184 [Bacteroidales bacterium Barb6]
MRRKLNLLLTALLLFAATGSVWAQGVIWADSTATNVDGSKFTATDENGNAVRYRVERPASDSVSYSKKGTGNKGTAVIDSIVAFSSDKTIAHLWDAIDVPLANTPTNETKWVTYKVDSIDADAFVGVETLKAVTTFLFHTSLSGFEAVKWPTALKDEKPALIIAGASTGVKTGAPADTAIPNGYLKDIQVPIASITLNTDGTGYTTNVSEWAKITTIGDSAFARLKVTGTIVIPATVTSIGTGAFYGAEATVNLSGATGLTAVGAGAFGGGAKVTGFFGTDGLFTITTAEPYAISGTDTVDIRATYNGEVQTPTVVFKIGEDTVKNTSVTWAPTELKDAKSYTSTEIALPNFEALQDSFKSLIRYTIAPKEIAASIVDTSSAYTGLVQTRAITLTGDVPLALADTTVVWSDTLNVGTAKAVVTLNGSNYTFASGKKDTTLTFTITPKILTADSVVFSATGIVYNGLPQTPIDSLTIGTLVKDKDYTVAWSNNTNAGTAKGVIKLSNKNYTLASSEANLSFTITPKSLTADSVKFNATGIVYSGQQQKPDDRLTITGAEKTDYTVAWSNNLNAGTAKGVITLSGNYTFEPDKKDTTTVTFAIGKANVATDVSWEKASSVPIADTTETKLKAAITGTLKSNSATKLGGADYKVVATSVTNILVKIAVSGEGVNYTGTYNDSIRVTTDSTGIAANVIWTGGIVYKADTANTAKLNSAVTGILKSNSAKLLVRGTDYTTDSFVVAKDIVKAFVTGKGAYYGSVTVDITVVDFPVEAGSGSGADSAHAIKVALPIDFTRTLTAKDFGDNRHYTIDLSHASGLKGIEGGTFGPNVKLKGVVKLVKLKDLILKATGDTALFAITVDDTDKFDATAIEDTIKIVNSYAAKRQEPKVIFVKEGVLHTSTVSWKNGQGLKDVGTYKPEIAIYDFSGLNGYFADHISYEIEPYKLTGDLTFTPKTELVYDGKAKTPSEFTLTTSKTHNIVLTPNDYDKDSIIWDKNTEAGEKTARVTFTITNPNFVEAGLSDGTGVKPVTATFTINKAEISTAGVRVINKVANKDGSVTLTGSDVVSSFGKFGTDFQFSSTSSSKVTIAATAPKEVKLKLLKKNLKNGENNADYTVSFKVAEKNIGSLSSSVKLSAKEMTYTGFPISPTVTIAGLSEHKDFEVVLYEGADTLSRVEGVKAGKYVIWAEGINTYGEHVSAGQFTINQADVAGKNVVWSTPAFTGDDSPEGLKALEKGITGTLQSESGKYRLKSEDYTATLAPSTNGEFVNVTINGNVKGNFKGSHTFRLDPTTGTEAVVAASAGSASYANGILTLTNLDGTTATVVSLNGRTAAKFRVSGNEAQKAVSLTPGFYILNAGKTVSKFIVR